MSCEFWGFCDVIDNLKQAIYKEESTAQQMKYLPIGENFLLYVNHRRALISDNSLDFSVIKCEIKIKSSYPI